MIHAETATTANPLPKPLDETAQAGVDYARVLRSIGQDLTNLFPKFLEIDTDGVNFVARGQSHPNPFQRVKESALKRTWTKLFGNDTEPHAPELPMATFVRSYTIEDLERLDQLYSANRTGQVKRPDRYSLAERLRTMGGIVNSRNGRLKQLRKNCDHLYVDYWDQDGKVQTAKLTTVILYRDQEPDHSRARGQTPREVWEGYDF